MNTFLHETVISFFPTECACAFVGEPWFFSNHTVLLAVLRLCESQYAHLIQTNSDEYEFEQHVLNLVASKLCDKPYFVVELVEGIPGGEYLLTRGWFCRSDYYLANVLSLRICGFLERINPTAGDFDEHIRSIMQDLMIQRELNSLTQDEDEDDDIESDDDDEDYSDRIIVARVMIDGQIVGVTRSQLDSFIEAQQNKSYEDDDEVIFARIFEDDKIVEELTKTELQNYMHTRDDESKLAYQIRCQEEDYLVLCEQQKEARFALEEINQRVHDLEKKLILCRP